MSQPDAASRLAIPAPRPTVRPTPVTSASGRDASAAPPGSLFVLGRHRWWRARTGQLLLASVALAAPAFRRRRSACEARCMKCLPIDDEYLRDVLLELLRT